MKSNKLEEIAIRHRLNKETNPSGELARLMYQRILADNEMLLEMVKELNQKTDFKNFF